MACFKLLATKFLKQTCESTHVHAGQMEIGQGPRPCYRDALASLSGLPSEATPVTHIRSCGQDRQHLEGLLCQLLLCHLGCEAYVGNLQDVKLLPTCVDFTVHNVMVSEAGT